MTLSDMHDDEIAARPGPPPTEGMREQTALELGIDRINKLAKEHPQTRFTPPVCRDDPCTCPTVQHTPTTRRGTVPNTGPFGLRRNKLGEFRWVKSTGVRFTEAIPATTADKMAKCAALGLDYWSDAPNGCVWAIDADRQAHQVKI